MTPLAPPTEAEVKEGQSRARSLAAYAKDDPRLIHLADAVDVYAVIEAHAALCDAYLAQREALRDARSVLVHIAAGHDPGHLRSSAMHVLGVVDAALSAAPLEDKP